VHGFPHTVKLRHVYRKRQAARKLPRQFLQRFGAAREQGDLRAAISQRDCRRQSDPRRSAGDDEHAILDLHRSLRLLHRSSMPPSARSLSE
jgi:hypothetical protein